MRKKKKKKKKEKIKKRNFRELQKLIINKK